MSEIELKQVGKRYGDVTVLSDISLEMADGEFVVLVGPSGCGKSTLLRMIAGLEDITSGQITIGGKVVNNMPAKERDIAMVFQSYALYPHMMVADNMSFSLRLAGAILGAMHGEAVIEPHEAAQIDTINRLDLAGEAETFSRTAWTILEDAETRYRAIARERTALCNATEDDRV